MKFGVGQPLRRKEDGRFLRGTGKYVDDLSAPGQLHAQLRRSEIAHGRIVSIDASAARAAPGVRLVYTAQDLAGRLNPLENEFPLQQSDGSPPAPSVKPHLAEGAVRYVGQPVAFVVADTPEAARDAAELIEVDYKDLPAVIDPADALAPGAPQLHAGAPGNLSFHWTVGDAAATEAAFAAAAKIVSAEAVSQRVIVCAMEPRSCTAAYDAGSGRWSIWGATQGSHTLRGRLAAQLGVEAERVRVRTPDVGGGFGMKLQAHPEDALVALAAKDLGKPVKWTADRSESFLSDVQARDMSCRAEGAFDADGRLTAMRFSTVSNLGAYYSTFGIGVHTGFSASTTGGMYDLPVFHHEVRGVFTNTTPTDAYRGAGKPEVMLATEMVMEAAAREFGMDRAEFRRRNLIKAAQVPYPTHGGFVFDSLDTDRNLDDALAASDWAGFESRAAEAAARGRLRGIGLTYYFERTGGGPVESALLRVLPEGRIEAAVGTQSNGQGHETAWAQIIFEKLGVHPSQVELLMGDSDVLPAGGGTGGSRSLIMASRVFLLAADEVIAKAMEGAAERLEAAAADIEYTVEDGGAFRIKGTDRSVSLFDAVAELGGVTGEGAVNDREATFPNGCHVAEVEVDPETGASTLVSYAIVDDFGVIVNPMIVEGQAHGGVAQGIGQVLTEAAAWDRETGQPLAASFMDYQLPRAADLPSFSFKLNEIPAKTNPLGVKGCGEAGSVGAVPAVALAMQDALLRGGAASIPPPPFTPQAVWRALQGV
ncbi:MAG: xanthine dehydrogenase family protein molybdopterin-binding subunit [Pseudomonadota bacterium]